MVCLKCDALQPVNVYLVYLEVVEFENWTHGQVILDALLFLNVKEFQRTMQLVGINFIKPSKRQ